jgi:hypothetical protein
VGEQALLEPLLGLKIQEGGKFVVELAHAHEDADVFTGPAPFVIERRGKELEEEVGFITPTARRRFLGKRWIPVKMVVYPAIFAWTASEILVDKVQKLGRR